MYQIKVLHKCWGHFSKYACTLGWTKVAAPKSLNLKWCWCKQGFFFAILHWFLNWFAWNILPQSPIWWMSVHKLVEFNTKRKSILMLRIYTQNINLTYTPNLNPSSASHSFRSLKPEYSNFQLYRTFGQSVHLSHSHSLAMAMAMPMGQPHS